MASVRWRPAAVADMLAIADYISNDNPAAAERLMQEIQEKVTNLPHNPRLYRIGRVAGTREMIVKSKYIVVYTETPEVISIVRILHAAREWPQP